jgi:Protein of unknown function (DUF3341)
MPGKSAAVFGIYSNATEVEGAIDALQAAGFRSTDISVLFPENARNEGLTHEKRTKAPEGAAAGGFSGAVLGGTLGWLAGMGMIAIPGVGPLIAAGPILSALAGVGIGGTVAGITGALIGTGIPEYEARKYEGRVKSGGILMSVQVDDSERARKARSILRDTGAEDISLIGEAAADHSKGNRSTQGPSRSSLGSP